MMKHLLIAQSLSPLFILLIIRMVPISCTNKYACCICLGACICLLATIASTFHFSHKKKRDAQGPVTIIETNDAYSSDKALEFTLTLIIPLLIGVPETLSDVIFFYASITFIWALLAKTTYWHNNPVLVVLGYKLCALKVTDRGNQIQQMCCCISREEITVGNKVNYSVIVNNDTWYVWRNGK